MLFALGAWLGILALVATPCSDAAGVLPTAEPTAVEPVFSEASGLAFEELQFLQEETVSIAARHEQPISEAPSTVYVITEEDIRHSGATDLPTVLRRIPGIEVIQFNGSGFSVSVRGNNQPLANKLLVMVDGRSIYEDIQGVVIWKAIPVTLPEIKRIEVVKGPISALYGFNAFDGLVHITTKSPAEIRGNTFQFGGGEFGTITSSAIHAGATGTFDYRLSVGHDQNSQWRDRNALSFRSYKFNVHTEYALADESKLVVAGGLVHANRSDFVIAETATNIAEFDLGYARIAYERPNFFFHSWWNGSYLEDTNITNPLLAGLVQVSGLDGSRVSVNDNNSFNVEAQHAIEFGSTHRLTYGTNYRHNTVTSNFIGPSSREDRLGFYVQHEWKILESLRSTAGVRLDLHSEINPTYNPRLGLLYKVGPEQTLRAALAVAYRPPTLFESNQVVQSVITLPPPFPSPPPQIILGNRDLDPEQIISYELGYQAWLFKHRLRIRGDLFFNHLSDLISFGTTAGAPGSFNAGEGDIYGGEASVEFLLTPWLSGFSSYAYQEVGQGLAGSARRGVPRFKINAGLRGELDNGFSGEVVLHHVGAATYPVSPSFPALAPLGGFSPPNPRVGSYNLLNLRSAYRVWRDKAELAVTAFNALNDKHKEHPLGETIGSRVMGWLTIKL